MAVKLRTLDIVSYVRTIPSIVSKRSYLLPVQLVDGGVLQYDHGFVKTYP